MQESKFIGQRRKALLIGVGQSETPKDNLKEVIRMGELLKNNADGTTNLYVEVLTDQKGALSSRKVMREVANVLNIKGNPELALLYFNGDAEITSYGTVLKLPVDEQDQQNGYNGVLLEDVLALMSASTIRQKILILDCLKADLLNILYEPGMQQEGVTILAGPHITTENDRDTYTELICYGLEGRACNNNESVTLDSLQAYLMQGQWKVGERAMMWSHTTQIIKLRDLQPSESRMENEREGAPIVLKEEEIQADNLLEYGLRKLQRYYYNHLRPDKSRKALLMGFANYGSKISDQMPACRNSIERIASKLNSCDRFNNFKCELLTDTPENGVPYKDEKELRTKIRSFLMGGRGQELGLLYFVGHGIGDPYQHIEPALVFPSGQDEKDAKPYYYIPMYELTQWIEKSSFGNLVVIIDACHSGYMFEHQHASISMRPGHYLITACSGDETALKSDSRNGNYTQFSGLVIQALSGGAANDTGIVSLASLYDYVCQGMGPRRHPIMRCNATSYLPLRYYSVKHRIEDLVLIHNCFAPGKRTNWERAQLDEAFQPTDKVEGWETAYRLRKDLSEEDMNNLNSCYKSLEDNKLIKKHGKEIILTLKGEHLWDMIHTGYYETQKSNS